MRLDQLKFGLSASDDRAKVDAWLDHINETDKEARDEVLELCKLDVGALSFFVGMFDMGVK